MPVAKGSKLKPWGEERRRKMEAFFARVRGVKRGRQCPPSERFWPKVDKNGPTIYPELGPCWVWTASTDGGGYGSFGLDGKLVKAHRFSWELKHGEQPKDDILHKCDNPPCVNPDHLFQGTASDNLKDCVAKGRKNPAKGRMAHTCKLTVEKVREIRARAAAGEMQITLAKEYGVGHTAIWSIVTRQTWADI